MTLWNLLRCHAGGRSRTLLAGRRGMTLALAGLLLLGACAQQGDDDAAGTAGSGRAVEESPTPAPSTPEAEIDPMPSDGTTPVGGRPWSSAVSSACGAAVQTGFVEVAQSADAEGVTSFWDAGGEWAVCDVLLDPASQDTLAVTVDVASRQAPGGFDAERLSLSTTAVGAADAPEAVRFVAGGLLPWPVQEIGYTFPDGHLEQATFVRSDDASGDTWWVVAYTATDGPLVDPASRSQDLEPVTISIVGAAAEAFRLPWEDLQRTE